MPTPFREKMIATKYDVPLDASAVSIPLFETISTSDIKDITTKNDWHWVFGANGQEICSISRSRKSRKGRFCSCDPSLVLTHTLKWTAWNVRPIEGKGCGLAICRRIVAQRHGRPGVHRVRAHFHEPACKPIQVTASRSRRHRTLCCPR